MKNLLPDDINKIKFNNRPDPVPYNYRISYKVAQLCLILYMIVKKGGCSFIKLQMVSVALSSKYDMVQMMDFINGKLPDFSIISFDPSVNNALIYAISDGLIEMQASNNKFRLSIKGKQFAQSIINDKELMISEKEYLNKIAGKLKDSDIDKLVDKWGVI